jgi:hypothetical protein
MGSGCANLISNVVLFAVELLAIDCTFPRRRWLRDKWPPAWASITGARPCTFLIEIVTVRIGSSVATILSISVVCLNLRRAKLSVTGFQACSPKSKRSKSILARQSNWIKLRARLFNTAHTYPPGSVTDAWIIVCLVTKQKRVTPKKAPRSAPTAVAGPIPPPSITPPKLKSPGSSPATTMMDRRS